MFRVYGFRLRFEGVGFYKNGLGLGVPLKGSIGIP